MALSVSTTRCSLLLEELTQGFLLVLALAARRRVILLGFVLLYNPSCTRRREEKASTATMDAFTVIAGHLGQWLIRQELLQLRSPGGCGSGICVVFISLVSGSLSRWLEENLRLGWRGVWHKISVAILFKHASIRRLYQPFLALISTEINSSFDSLSSQYLPLF